MTWEGDACTRKREPQPKPWQEKLTGNSLKQNQNRFNQNKISKLQTVFYLF